MARSRRSRRRVSRPRRIIRRRSNRSITAAPPRLNLTSNTRRIVIPYGFDVSGNKHFVKDVTFSDVMSYSPNLGLTFQYAEVKVHQVRVFYQTDSGTSDSGSICMIVADSGENQYTSETPFHELMSYPGAMVRRVWQNVSGVWFPTEPADRNWMQMTDGLKLVNVLVRHSLSTGVLAGRIMCLCSVSVRGRNITRCKAALAALDAREESESVDSVPFGLERLELEHA